MGGRSTARSRRSTRFGLPGPADRWRALADASTPRSARGLRRRRATPSCSTTAARTLDAALLMLPLVGFLPPDDPRVAGTVAAIQRELCVDGLVRRYIPDDDARRAAGRRGRVPRLLVLARRQPGADGRARRGARALRAAARLLQRPRAVAEEYDPLTRRQLGNFPQAFSHIALVNSAHNLTSARGAGGRARPRRRPELGIVPDEA